MTAKQSNKPSMPDAPWDKGAMGPANRHRLRREPATEYDPATGKDVPLPNNVKRMRRQSWVAIYRRGSHITQSQAAAAEMLRRAADGLPDRDPFAAIGEVRATPCSDVQAAKFDARRQFHRLWAMIPPASKPIVERVVIEDMPIWTRGGTPARERHMERLAEGLDAISAGQE